MYSPGFIYTFEKLMRNEGGYVNDPADPGGATNYGISLRWYKRAVDAKATKETIKNLTEAQAKKLYFIHWWERYSYDKINATFLAAKVCDISVNMGPQRAHKLLQQALIACEHDVTVDGVLGPKTLLGVNSVYTDTLLAAFRSECAGHYRVLIAKRPAFKRFERGWLRRAYE